MPKGYVLKTNAHGIFFDGARRELRADVDACRDHAATFDILDCGAHSNSVEDADKVIARARLSTSLHRNIIIQLHYTTTSHLH